MPLQAGQVSSRCRGRLMGTGMAMQQWRLETVRVMGRQSSLMIWKQMMQMQMLRLRLLPTMMVMQCSRKQDTLSR